MGLLRQEFIHQQTLDSANRTRLF